MPKISIPKESLEGPKMLPPGIYWLRMDGFNPEYTKEGNSINLIPDLKVVNNPDFHDRRPGREWLNSKAGWQLRDFCHCFVVQLEVDADGQPQLPGEFLPPDEPDPTKWRYSGPLLGKTGKVELAEAYGRDGRGPYINIKRYFCSIAGCTERHSDDLLTRKS